MTLRLLLLAAAVLFVFAVIAGAAATGTFLTVGWPVWAAAGLLAWVLDALTGEWTVGGPGPTART